MGAIDRATRLVEKRVWKNESDAAESQCPQSDDTHDADASDSEGRPAQLNLAMPVPVVVSTADVLPKEGRAAVQQSIETRTRPDTGTTDDAPKGSASDSSLIAKNGKAAESESQVRTTQPVRTAPRISLRDGGNGNGKVETICKVSAEDWFSLAKWA
jgi:hypothetical protein